jgi:hypothetical protein
VSSWSSTRGSLAAEIRLHGPDSPRATKLRQKLKAERAEDYITRLVDGWPPLTPRQLAGLSSVLADAARIAAELDGAGPAEQGAA